jgi:DNA-directed RNA polymerase subunit beta'
VPLSVESQIEARVLMLSSNNILSPANGSPIIVPSQDIVLGTYYMTRGVAGRRGEGKIFANVEEVQAAFDAKEVDLHANETTVGRVLMWEIIPQVDILELRHLQVDTEEEALEVFDQINKGRVFSGLVKKYSQSPDKKKKGLIGKLSFNEFRSLFGFQEADIEAVFSLKVGDASNAIFADKAYHFFEIISKEPAIPYKIVNEVMNKKMLRQLVDYVYRNLGPKATVILSDRLKDIGYKYSTQGGLSIAIDDMIIPAAKWDILNQAESQVSEIGRQYTEGLITQGEKYNKIVDIWAKATDDVANKMMESMELERAGEKTSKAAKKDASAGRDAGPDGQAVRGNY